MDNSNQKYVEEFASLPKYNPLPTSSYKKLWKICDNKSAKNLFMTVVESPSLQLIQSDIKIRRLSAARVISSAVCSLRNNLTNLTKRYTLDFFRSEPFSPFIPDLLLYGINEIENECHIRKDWSAYYYCEKEGDHNRSDEVLRMYIANPGATDSLRDSLSRLSTSDIALCVLKFFTIFEKKPLHFHSSNLRNVLKEPLYDVFLRPKDHIRDIVQACVLKSSRTEVDTLAFMMTHIIHIWEYTHMPYKTKIKLSKLFGPRIISFEDPVFVYKTDDVSSPQSAMLEAVLEICDGSFWENLNYNRREDVFATETHFERNRNMNKNRQRERPPEFAYMCTPYSLFPSVQNSMDYYNNELYKKSTFYSNLDKVMR